MHGSTLKYISKNFSVSFRDFRGKTWLKMVPNWLKMVQNWSVLAQKWIKMASFWHTLVSVLLPTSPPKTAFQPQNKEIPTFSPVI